MKRYIQQLKEQLIELFKKRNTNIFLIFFLFSSAVWLLIKLSRTYNEYIVVNLNYINLAKNEIIADNSTKQIKVKIQGTGFQLLRNSFFTKTYNFDTDVVDKSSENIYINTEEFRSDIKNNLFENSEVTSVVPSRIILDIDSLSGKKVKILPEISLNFEQGYQLRDSLKISPKEISVYGPSEVLDTLQYVYTQRKSLTNLKENFTLDLGLKKPKAAKLQLETNQVHIVGLVDRFTEKEFKLPVRFINVPAGVTLKVFPEEVPVLVRGSLEDLKKIKNSDFDLVCDFDALQPTTTFASTFLKRAPMSITIVDIKDENLQVLIKEK